MKLPSLLHRCWQMVRSISGDDAYERYVTHCNAQHPDAVPQDRAEFYRREQERRWSGGPNRCC